MSSTAITHLFLDIGGVLLTNGWDRHMRREAAQKFGLDLDDLNDRHKMSFDTYEQGKLNLDTYLHQVVFYRERPFTRDDFKEFHVRPVQAQSRHDQPGERPQMAIPPEDRGHQQ